MKILITGSTGLLGQALSRHFAPTAEVTGLSRNAPTAHVSQRHVVCDLQDGRTTMQHVTALRPEVVIHAQALSNVDRCEQDPQLARAMNVTATTHVVSAGKAMGSWIIYVSTDYVFDGKKGCPYDETDATNPLSVYGASKLEGERVVLDYARGLVVRPSTLFGSGRTNFCDHIVSRVQSRQLFEAFRDQRTSPTYTEDLSEGILDVVRVLLRQGPDVLPASRVLHMANDGGCSRLELARRVVDLLGGSHELIKAIDIAEQRRLAARPVDSRLATRHLAQVIGRTLRPWHEALDAYLRERQWLA